MSWVNAVLSFFGIHADKPRVVITPVGPVASTNAADAAEVDSLRERYSAARYVQHLAGAMKGHFTGRGEWARRIHSLSEDDYRVFFWEVDEIIDAGGLVHVLTAEETAQVKANVMAKVDEYREAAKGKPMDIDPAFMHAIMNDPDCDVDIDEMDESEASAWLEDIEDADIGEEGDTDAEDERPEEGREEEQGQGQADEEGRVLT